MSRPRPFASRRDCTAAWSNASAPMPYTVSVGSTTRSPCCTACAAASIAVSRSSSLAVGYVVLIGPLLCDGVGSSCQPRGQEARPTGQVAMVAYLLPSSGAGEHGGSGLTLHVGVLD